MDDYFLVLVAGYPLLLYEVPTEPADLQQLAEDPGIELQRGVANRTDFTSRIMWPTALESRPLFRFTGHARTRGRALRTSETLRSCRRSPTS